MGAKPFASPKKAKPNPFSVKKSDNGKVNPFSKKSVHTVTRAGHDYSDPTGLEITKFREIDGRYWVALVAYKGTEMEFHNRFGSWMADVNADNTEAIFSRDGMHGSGRMRDALPYVATLLSEKMPKPEPKPDPKKEVKNPWAKLSKSKSEKKSSSASAQATKSEKKSSRSSKAAKATKGTGRAQRTRKKR